MKKATKLCMQIDLLVNLQKKISCQGIDKKSANLIASVESDISLPYPPSAYSNEPSITFKQASLESLGRIILDKLGNVVDFIIDLFSKFYKYLLSLFDSDYSKRFKEQKDYHTKATKFYEQSLKSYENKPKVAAEAPQKSTDEILDQHLTEELASAKERLNGVYTNLLETIHTQRNKAMYLLIAPQMADKLNDSTMAIVENVRTALDNYSKGRMNDLTDAKMKALAFRAMTEFQKTASATNAHFAKANAPLLNIPPYLRTNEDFIFPYIYLRDCISVIREASFTTCDVNYVEDRLLKGKTAYRDLEDFAVRADLLFQKDEIFKHHKDFVKIKKELLAAKKKISSKGIAPEYTGVYREAMLEYLNNVTATVNYSILFRQTNKIMMRNILRFINAETSYLLIRSKIMNQA